MLRQFINRRGTFFHTIWIQIGFLVFFTTFSGQVSASLFNSGSTGTDGAFAPTSSMTLTVPASGVFNFTTVNIPSGVTVSFAPNATNMPVTILASGNVTINGTLNLNGQNGTSLNPSVNLNGFGAGGAGGPGGYAGGAGAIAPVFNNGIRSWAGFGLGPGGGSVGDFVSPYLPFGYGGTYNYGNANVIPLLGGSGGAGGPGYSGADLNCGTYGCNGGGGGGGGGAILIASSLTMSINGTITVNGGAGGTGYLSSGFCSGNCQGGSGGGSGGGIRLVANTVTGAGTLTAQPGQSGSLFNGAPTNFYGPAGLGRIRLEANIFTFTGNISPIPSVSVPGFLKLTTMPMLAITSVGGFTAPSSPAGSFATPDITLPSSNSGSPINVAISGSNIPSGTTVTVTAYQQIGQYVGCCYGGNQTPISATTTVSGTTTSSSGSVSMLLYNTTPYVLIAQATFSVALASNDFPVYAGGEKVDKVRVTGGYGGESKVTLITASGKEVPLEKGLWN